MTSRRTQRSGERAAAGGRRPWRLVLAGLVGIVVLVVAAGALSLVIANTAQAVYTCASQLDPATPGPAVPGSPVPAPSPSGLASPAATAAVSSSGPAASAAGAAPASPGVSVSASPGASASPAASAVPGLGQQAPDLGRIHVNLGDHVTYLSCPPASGPHYNNPGKGPVPDRFYGPDEAPPPQGWVHNLEHGEMVILYRCPGGSCDQASLDALRAFGPTIPPSPRCGVANDVVITRFDDMKAPFAAIVWDRVLFLDSVDTAKLTQFFLTQAETNAPEHKC